MNSSPKAKKCDGSSRSSALENTLQLELIKPEKEKLFLNFLNGERLSVQIASN
jgi:hypothetical protein